MISRSIFRIIYISLKWYVWNYIPKRLVVQVFMFCKYCPNFQHLWKLDAKYDFMVKQKLILDLLLCCCCRSLNYSLFEIIYWAPWKRGPVDFKKLFLFVNSVFSVKLIKRNYFKSCYSFPFPELKFFSRQIVFEITSANIGDVASKYILGNKS